MSGDWDGRGVYICVHRLLLGLLVDRCFDALERK